MSMKKMKEHKLFKPNSVVGFCWGGVVEEKHGFWGSGEAEAHGEEAGDEDIKMGSWEHMNKLQDFQDISKLYFKMFLGPLSTVPATELAEARCESHSSSAGAFKDSCKTLYQDIRFNGGMWTIFCRKRSPSRVLFWKIQFKITIPLNRNQWNSEKQIKSRIYKILHTVIYLIHVVISVNVLSNTIHSLECLISNLSKQLHGTCQMGLDHNKARPFKLIY